MCKELDGEYTELNEWMDGVAKELHACQPITLGMPAKELMAQQQHNNVSGGVGTSLIGNSRFWGEGSKMIEFFDRLIRILAQKLLFFRAVNN